MSTAPKKSVQSKFRFSIPVISFDKFETPEFIVGEAPWQIRVRKDSSGKDGLEYRIHIHLACNFKQKDPKAAKWWIEAGAILKLISFNAEEQSIVKTIPMMTFNDERLETEFENFITWQELTNKSKNFVKAGKVEFEAVVSTSALGMIQAQLPEFEQISEQSILSVSIMTEGYHYDSPKVTLRGIKWFVRFLALNTSLNIQLYNDTDPLNFGWSFRVTFKVKLLRYDDELKPLEKCVKGRAYAESTGIGWKSFITLEQLKDEANNFIKNNKAMFVIWIDVDEWQPFWKNEMSLDKCDSMNSVKCPVCLDSLADSEIKSTICGHLFCSVCLVASVNEHKRCPTCNGPASLDQLRTIFLH